MTTSTLPLPTSLSDERLAGDITRAIQDRRNGAFFQIRVRVDDGVVMLSGKLHSFYEKQLLLNTVQRVPGVEGVVDEVEVLPG